MLTVDFPGSHALIDIIDEAVSQGSTPAITDNLRHSLSKLICANQVQLPRCVFEPYQDHYARREIYHSEQHGYCVVAMTWGPGQGTLIHDHDGMWCVEGVCDGALDVVQYERVENDETNYHFRAVGSVQAGAGSAGSLVPPHEYHSIRNPSADAIAISLHVYSGRMTHCAVFQPLESNGWYRRVERELGLDLIE